MITTVPGMRGAGPLARLPLQPGRGRIDGEHYLASTPQTVCWGYVPSVGTPPVLRVRSGATVTVDTVSHEGLLEDQGRDPVSWFSRFGVAAGGVLADAVDLAANAEREADAFDVAGPHLVVGPVFVEGAEAGDVLKVETLSTLLRVPYGVVSSRHGKGALPRLPGGLVPDGLGETEIMPPVATDGRAAGVPTGYGNVSLFTPVRHAGGALVGEMPRAGGLVRFPLAPFMGLIGVASSAAPLSSVPPTVGGGNIDIRHLTAGSALYLPVAAEGALFFTGDPHMAQGHGEVALTALEGSLRTTFRLTVCKPGSGDAPSVAFRYPFGETGELWLPVGLSDPADGGGVDLDVAMRRCVVNALDFLEQDLGMDRAVAYAYLSAAADLEVSQVVDRTVGMHMAIRKAHFDG